MIISKIESKSLKGKILYGLIFLFLTVGSLTMLYPFALMVSGSLRSELDETDLDLLPSFFHNTDVLYRKFLETKYNQRVGDLNQATLQQNFSFRQAAIPPAGNPRLIRDFERFYDETQIPVHWQALGGISGIRTVPENLRTLRKRVEHRFDGNLEAFSRTMGGVIRSWQNITLSNPDWLSFRYSYPDNPVMEIYFGMLAEAPIAERQIVSLSGYFLDVMIYPLYGQSSTVLFNQAHTESLDAFNDFRLPRTVPSDDHPLMRTQWIEFVREDLNPSFVVLEGVGDDDFREFLVGLYDTIDALNLVWGTKHPSFDAIFLPNGEWLAGSHRTDYHEFLIEQDPATYVLVGPEFAWTDWLEETYGSVDALNEMAGTQYTSFSDVLIPMPAIEMAYVLDNRTSLRFTYAVRNFINVFDALFIHGRAFVNTLIFCTASVLLSLLINPLTAYAISRFKLPGTYKILLLLMATMAFPPMVTLIPTFIILQKLNLMNTFAALILPTIASGYLIFLLKGFFDSLPRELYEAATIDGASEVRIFFQITMSLSKPILAVVALNAFNSAYTMFLFPLLVAPSEDMWLLSVWLYQFQSSASMGGVFASVLIAAVPTLLLFIFCQNIIMRGIVVPVEK